MLGERIDRLLLDLDAEIARLTAQHTEALASLQRRKLALQRAKALITPEIEAAITALEAVGLNPIGQ
jgi:hypothetical protein